MINELDIVKKSIARVRDRIIAANDAIYSFAELSYEEYRSADTLIDILKEENFEVETGLAGIPTCFRGSWGEGSPVIGILGEFDALDNLSQCAGLARRQPESEGAPGHGCGHCALGSGALGAAIAVKDYLEETGGSGRVIYFGCPAEEGAGSKQFMARAGLFDDVDFVYTWHPGPINEVANDSSNAIMGANFSFKGKAAHAGSSPWLGRSALDAAELMNTGCNYLREHIMDGERIHYAFANAGGTAPNVVPEFAMIKYEVRSPKASDLETLFARVVKVAEGAALMTETEMSYEITMAFSDMRNNSVLAGIADEALRELGAPDWDEDDYRLAEEFASTFEDEYKEAPYLHDSVLAYDPSYIRMEGGSSDVGDVSYTVPTCEIHVAGCALGTIAHSWQMAAQSGCSIGHKGLLRAAEAIALSCIRTQKSPDLIRAAREETILRNGGRYKCPLPDDVMPPIGRY